MIYKMQKNKRGNVKDLTYIVEMKTNFSYGFNFKFDYYVNENYMGYKEIYSV